MPSLASSDDTETLKLVLYWYMLKHKTGAEKELVL